MTQDEIIELARQAGIVVTGEAIYTLCKLVAEKERERMTVVAMNAAEKAVDVAIKLEREACAKECWKQMGLLPIQAWTVNPYEQCIDAIRARGQA